MESTEVLFRLQKQLYEALLLELKKSDTKPTAPLVRYAQAFYSQLPSQISPASTSSFHQRLHASDVILVGDYHSLAASQFFFLELLKQDSTQRKHVLCLEALCVTQQADINHYLKGNVSFEKLWKKLRADAYWPFPWEGYAQLLKQAKRKRWSIKAIGPSKNLAPAARDQFFARQLKRFFGHPSAPSCFWVLVGEFHLAQNHLPLKLRDTAQKRTITCIHQNVERLYWKAFPQIETQAPSVFLGSHHQYFVFHTPPWIKLKSYLAWLDHFSHEEGSPPFWEAVLFSREEEVQFYLSWVASFFGGHTHFRKHASLTDKRFSTQTYRFPNKGSSVYLLPKRAQVWIANEKSPTLFLASSLIYLWNHSTTFNHALRQKKEQIKIIGYLRALAFLYFHNTQIDTQLFSELWLQVTHRYFRQGLTNLKRKKFSYLDLKQLSYNA